MRKNPGNYRKLLLLRSRFDTHSHNEINLSEAGSIILTFL